LRMEAPVARGERSKTVTWCPRSAADHACASPTMPAPITATFSCGT
jgi:hypothetical protein